MRWDSYGLGLDVGDSTVTVAVCHSGEERIPAEPRRLRLSLPGEDDAPAGQAMARIGDPVPLYVGGRAMPAAEAVADVVTALVDRIAEEQGRRPGRTVLTVPPSWGEHRRRLLEDALAGRDGEADGPAVVLVSGAVAVTRHTRATGALPAEATVAVYDLGASTLDTAVVRSSEDGGIEHVAPPPAPVPWGGRDVDDAVVAHVSAFLPPPVRRRGLPPLPAVAPTALRGACVAAKEALCTETDVRVEVAEGTRPIRLVREDLDELVGEAVAASVETVRAGVTQAGLEPAELDGIVLAGGGARLPVVAEALSAALGRPVLVTAEPELAAARGAAELAVDLITAPVPAEAGDDEPDPAGQHDRPVDELSRARVRHAARREGGRGFGTAARRAGRVGIVAAFFIALLVVPVVLLAALDDDVLTPQSSTAAAAADEPVPPPPAPAPSPAAAVAPAPAQAAHDDAVEPAAQTSVRTSANSPVGGPRSTRRPATTGGGTAQAPPSTQAAGPAPAGTPPAPQETGSPAGPGTGMQPPTDTGSGTGTPTPPGTGTPTPPDTSTPTPPDTGTPTPPDTGTGTPTPPTTQDPPPDGTTTPETGDATAPASLEATA
ncbi:Hsp70 family protein [Geodermatophilus sp. URMC 64]